MQQQHEVPEGIVPGGEGATLIVMREAGLPKLRYGVQVKALWRDLRTFVPFVNRPFESEIHDTVNFTQFCCVLLVTWCYRVLLSCYLRPK